MPSYLVRVTILVVCSFACGLALRAEAGWGQNFVRGVLPSLVKRAAISLIERELYDLEESGGRDYSGNASSSDGYRWKPRPALDYLPKDGSPSDEPNSNYGDSSIKEAFRRGAAGQYDFDQLVKANIFVLYPLHGSVFKRDSSVKYIILHSTETASVADARRVIQSWNNRGKRHPGAQFVVDRDGTICSTTNPDLATVHINTSKTLPGYTNDNSVGIEIVRAGKQTYTHFQLDSVMYLVTYLQEHYQVPDANVTTHHHVQPSDRSDPVGFDLVAFETAKSTFRQEAIASGESRWKPVQLSRWKHAPVVHPVASMPKPAPDFRLRR